MSASMTLASETDALWDFQLAAADAALQNHWAEAAVDRVGDDRRAWGEHDGALALRWVAWLAEQGQIEAAFQQDGGAAFGGLAAGIAAARGAFVTDLAAARVAEMSGFNLADDAFLQSLAATIVGRAQAAGQAAVSLAEQTADADSALAAALAGSLRTLLRTLADADEAGQRAEADLAVTLASWLGDAQVAWTTSAHNAWRDYVRDTTLADAPVAAAGSAALRDTRIRSAGIALAAENDLAGPRATASGLIAAAEQASSLTTTQAKADRKVNEADERLQLILVKPANEFTDVRPERPRTARDRERDYYNGLLDSMTAGWTEDMRRRDTGRWNYSVDTTSRAYAWGRGTGNAAVFLVEVGSMGECTALVKILRVLAGIHGGMASAKVIHKAYLGEKFELTDYVDLVSVALNVFGMVGRMRGLLSSCFVAQTDVLALYPSGSVTITDTAVDALPAEQSAGWTVVSVAAIGTALALQMKDKKKSRRQRVARYRLNGQGGVVDSSHEEESSDHSVENERGGYNLVDDDEDPLERAWQWKLRRAEEDSRKAQARIAAAEEARKSEGEQGMAVPQLSCRSTPRTAAGFVSYPLPLRERVAAQPPGEGAVSSQTTPNRSWLKYLLLAIAAFSGWKALPDSWRPGADVRPAAASVSTSTPRAEGQFKPTPIETIEPGRRVLANNPTGEEDDEFGDDVDPDAWRRLKLTMLKENGGRLWIDMLRPAEWIDTLGLSPGEEIFLDLAELGIRGDAVVSEVGPCPPIVRGPGRVVTATFRHENATVLDLHLAGLNEPIGVTPTHPFWSEERGRFVAAGELRRGERLLAIEGTTRVLSFSQRPLPETVYNLEVQGAHTYHVTANGVLVHNACTYALRRSLGVLKGGGDAHHVVAALANRFKTAGKSRDILQRAGISLESYYNGVMLSRKAHKGIHTERYYKNVYHRLRDSESSALQIVKQNNLTGKAAQDVLAEHAIQTLDGIKKDLLKGNKALWKK